MYSNANASNKLKMPCTNVITMWLPQVFLACPMVFALPFGVMGAAAEANNVLTITFSHLLRPHLLTNHVTPIDGLPSKVRAMTPVALNMLKQDTAVLETPVLNIIGKLAPSSSKATAAKVADVNFLIKHDLLPDQVRGDPLLLTAHGLLLLLHGVTPLDVTAHQNMVVLQGGVHLLEETPPLVAAVSPRSVALPQHALGPRVGHAVLRQDRDLLVTALTAPGHLIDLTTPTAHEAVVARAGGIVPVVVIGLPEAAPHAIDHLKLTLLSALLLLSLLIQHIVSLPNGRFRSILTVCISLTSNLRSG